MSYEYIAETITSEDGKHRALIVGDICPSEPYDDGGSPILQLDPDSWGGYRAEQVKNLTSYVVDESINQAAERFAQEPDTFERYLRIFHGVTEVKWRNGGYREYTYVTFDPADWREKMGLPVDKAELADYAEKHDLKPGWLVSMDEWKAYVEGDCYGIVIEERATWQRVPKPGQNTVSESRETWEDVESCWGYYGWSDYVQEAAREMLADAAKDAELLDRPVN